MATGGAKKIAIAPEPVISAVQAVSSKPYKVLWRYKNRNERIQYNMYIFAGNVDKRVKKVLERITELSLYDTLVALDDKERHLVESIWGEEWFRYLFPTAHIESTFSLLQKNKARATALEEIVGKGWIERNRKQPGRKLIYSYEEMIKDDRERKALKKIRHTGDDDETGDYRTEEEGRMDERVRTILEEEQIGAGKKSTSKKHKNNAGFVDTTDGSSSEEEESCSKMDGKSRALMERIGVPDDELSGGDSEGDDGGMEPLDVIDESDGANTDDEEPLASVGANVFDDEMDMEMDEIEKIYHDDIDVNASKTNKLIRQVLENETTKTVGIAFDTAGADANYDQDLSNVWRKTFVYNEFIYGNDTIKAVRNKICCTLKQDPMIDSAGWLMPGRQYMWSEYTFDNKLEKVMIGQKWIRRNELLPIDTVPSPKMHMYERLQGNLKMLHDSMRRYGSKIRREDDENIILEEYDQYMNNHEFYMVDLYHELGMKYSPASEALRNMYEVYIRIYFSRVRMEEMRNIIEYLSGKGEGKSERLRVQQTHDTLINDMLVEHEIMDYVESVRNSERNHYSSFFKQRYITQSVIHVNLYEEEASTLAHKLDLYRIFDSFLVGIDYPFVQRQMLENEKTWRFHEETIYCKDNLSTTMRWFENAPHGLSFRIRIKTGEVYKYVSINLTDTGRIEYKTQWREEDMATITDIEKTYDYVKLLVGKINAENLTARNKIRIPENEEFRYAFINTIQKFELPYQTIIDHNDLSDFARFFFPYVALQVEPRKRQSKLSRGSDKGKYGTYLRYKRVSRYDNQLRMEHRIIYFMRNYDYTDTGLAGEIAKQFNITESRAADEIDRVHKKYPSLKRSRKIMKKLENIPKYKPPGIEIAIQGKLHEKYKIRVSGARDQLQTAEIVDFMNVVIYLYYETYILKKPERQMIKERLKGLTDIAKRRNRVEEIVRPSADSQNIKLITQMDRKRLAFKPEEGENQWSRSCQNSGDDKRRQPQIYTSVDDLHKVGYRQNKAGEWSRTVKIGKHDVVLKAIRLVDRDEDGGSHERFYTCNNKDNGTHMHIGFLTRSLNPFGLCMPCCYKKDHSVSKNKEKREFFKRCLSAAEGEAPSKIVGDRLYILQDTNKIQEGRLSFLPRYLDVFFNTIYGNKRRLKNHYLVSTDNTGYVFKYGSLQEEHPFLNAVSACFEKPMEEVRQRMITVLKEDDDRIFTSLNNGDIRSQFTTRKHLIEFIEMTTYVDWDIMADLVSTPGCILPNGLNIVILEKQVHVIRQHLEKERIREDYYPICTNTENLGLLQQPGRRTAILLKEGRHYYPLAQVVKLDENSRVIKLDYTFAWEDNDRNMVNQLYKYYRMNCCSETVELLGIQQLPIAKKMVQLLHNKDPARAQFIDKRNRCRYLLTKSGTIIPTRPSGTIWNLPLRGEMTKYLLTVDETVKRYDELKSSLGETFPVRIVGVYFDESDGDKIHSVSLKLNFSNDSIPVIPTWDSRKRLLNELDLQVQNRPIIDKIDHAIESGKEQIDVNMLKMGREKFENESYELFRLELSDYLERHAEIRQRLVRIIDKDSPDRKMKIRELLFRLIDTDLWQLYRRSVRGITGKEKAEVADEELQEDIETDEPSKDSTEQDSTEQDGGVRDRLALIRTKIKDEKLSHYRINNQRSVCRTITHEGCTVTPHCSWVGDRCQYSTTRDLLLQFINRVSEELANEDPQSMKKLELLRSGDYFVSDIVDYNQYTERPGQRIVRSTSSKITSILEDLFGRDAVPKLGRRKVIQTGEVDYIALNIANPSRNMGEFIVQTIHPGRNTLYRAYANGFYWIGHSYQEQNYRNLGYYSPLQTQLSNYYKNAVVQWIRDSENRDDVENVVLPYSLKWINTKMYRELALKLAKTLEMATDGWIELYILSKIHPAYPIVVHDENNRVKYRFQNGVIDESVKLDKMQTIHIILGNRSGRSIPDTVESLYYI
jgi:hypothetical protein